MTTPETFTIAFSSIACIVSLWSIMPAIAAKRSAIAAELQAGAAKEQAEHAKTQAGAAVGQAASAERQVAIMQTSFIDDRVGRAMKARRIAIQCRDTVKALDSEIARAQSSVHISQAFGKARSLAEALEDTPPVFPKSVRLLIFDYVQRVFALDLRPPGLNGVSHFPRETMERIANQLIVAMDVAIGDKIAAISD